MIGLTMDSRKSGGENRIFLKDIMSDFKRKVGLEYKTNLTKLGIKIKSYNIDGVESKHTKYGTKYTFNVDKCDKWMKEKGYVNENGEPQIYM